jgi:lipopolysaccharide-induced tumor necrosis factor-alpha factor
LFLGVPDEVPAPPNSVPPTIPQQYPGSSASSSYDMPPQYQGAAPPMYAQTMYTAQPVIIAPYTMGFSENPMQMQCPNCHARILTRVSYKNGALTWLICGGLCLFG